MSTVHPRNWRITALFVLAVWLLALVLVTGCQRDLQPAAPAETSAEASTPLEGGVAVLAVTQEPDFLDPHQAISAGTKELLFNVYEGLFKLSPQGEFLNCLADEFTLSDDGREIKIKLKEGVTFHDGRPMSVEDVLFSIDRVAGRGDLPAMSSAHAELQAQKLGESTVLIKTAEFDPDLLAHLSFAIVPADSTKLNEEPCGTGPFKLREYKAQSHIFLEKNHNYHGTAAHLDAVKVLILSDRDAASLDLQAGQIDIFPYLGPEKIAELENDYQIYDGSANMVQLWAFNNADPVLKDQKLRLALLADIDRQQIIELVMNGHGTAIYSALSPALRDSFNNGLDEPSMTRAEAEAYLREHAAGLQLDCRVPANYIIHLDTAEVLKAQLAEVGVTLKISRVDWLTWLDEVYSQRKYQTTIIALTFDEFTARCALERYQSDASRNFINFHSEDYDRILAELLQNPETSERQLAYKQLQAILTHDAASAFLQDPAALTAVRRTLAGYTQYPAYIQDLSTVYFVDAAALEASRAQEP